MIFIKDEIEIHLWTTTDPEVPKSTGCYVHVTNVDKLSDNYKSQGITHPNGRLKDMLWEMRQFSILDNNVNIIHFGEYISKNKE